MLRILASITCLAGLVAAPAALAQSPECTCRFAGRDVEFGKEVCMPGPNGPAMARCDMSQNVTNWVRLTERCPEANMTPRFAVSVASAD